MPDVALLDIQGARPEKPSKYTSLATLKFIGGLQTQRSPFMSIDTRYNSRYLGGKPDALIAGSNVELSNRLTLIRRPGLDQYGTAHIPAPDFFFDWQQSQTANFISIVDPANIIYPDGNLSLIIDTPTNGTTAPGNIYTYSPTNAGILVNKAASSGQTSFETVISTMYMGDGVDLYKDTGANLLAYSNTFTNSIWSSVGTTSITPGQADPMGGNNATAFIFSSFGYSSTAYLLQHVSKVDLSGGTPSTSLNYTPVSNNTFTFSIWMKSSVPGASIFMQMTDSTAAVIANVQQTLTSNWALYQVTGVASNGATGVTVIINDPSSSVATYDLYGAQLEVGGPATPTIITTTKPLGIYLWGITPPTSAITFTTTKQTGSTGAAWQPNHAYSQTTYSITSVGASTALSSPVTTGGITYTTGAVYTGTVSVAANSLIGAWFSITGATDPNNNTVQDTHHPGTASPGFVCLGNNGSTTLILSNLGATVATSQTITARQLDTVVDSNGNLEVAYIPGTSGGTQPIWSLVQGGLTSDGLQNLIVQSVPSTQSNSSGAGTATFGTNTTVGNTLFVYMLQLSGASSGVPTMSGETFTLVKSNLHAGRNLDLYIYAAGIGGSGIAGGQTAINWTGTGSASWVGIAEIAHQLSTDNTASNFTQDTIASSFPTGSVTPTSASPSQADIITTFAAFVNGQTGFQIGVLPFGYQSVVSQTPNVSDGHGQQWNMGAGINVVLSATAVNPTWSITNSNTGFNDTIGISAATVSSVGTLVWYNLGQVIGLSPKVGYTWYYAFVNTYTGHRSDVSPLSASTGTQTGVTFNLTGTGASIKQSGTGAGVANANPLVSGTGDPQVDAIEIYRNIDGGGFWYQVPPTLLTNATLITGADGKQYIKNPGTTTSQGTWMVTDGVLDSQLNTQIFAPVGFLNAVPPQGLKDLEFFAGRLWGSVGATLYYATGADDAALINIVENGVSAESWEPTNFIPFNAPIVRIVSVGAGLVVFTTTDVWIVAGSNLATFQSIRVLAGIGLGNYNGLCLDGSNIIFFTRDRQCLQFNVNSAASEIGFLIGDLLEAKMNPIFTYLARHVKGSQDNAFYFGDGLTGWFRLNPNQYGASVSGEQTSLWSPFATIASAGGAGAIASIEVQPGIKELLVGAAFINPTTGAFTTGTFPILNRDITVFTDNGSTYGWNATIGSIMLALPGKLAEIESITTEMTAAVSSQCSVAVLIDEVSGPFETLTYMTNDPPQLATSLSVLSNRFYLSAGTVPPIGRHMQIQLTGNFTSMGVDYEDELLALTVRGALIEEQQ